MRGCPATSRPKTARSPVNWWRCASGSRPMAVVCRTNSSSLTTAIAAPPYCGQRWNGSATRLPKADSTFCTCIAPTAWRVIMLTSFCCSTNSPVRACRSFSSTSRLGKVPRATCSCKCRGSSRSTSAQDPRAQSARQAARGPRRPRQCARGRSLRISLYPQTRRRRPGTLRNGPGAGAGGATDFRLGRPRTARAPRGVSTLASPR